MPYGLYLSAEGAHAQSSRLEIIAHNLANVETAGFKRELAILQARYAEATQQGLDQPGSGSINDLGGGVRLSGTQTDFSEGPIRNTGVPTDLAIRGEGFFVVQRDGQKYLTRAGEFHVNELGQLVTQYGQQKFAVLDENYSPIVLARNTAWDVSPTGTIRQGGTATNLALVRPQSLGELVREGENVFRPASDPVPLGAHERSVAWGFLEGSGVNPTTEMVAMIEASRALEANLNMMQTQDEMLAGLVKRVMRV